MAEVVADSASTMEFQNRRRSASRRSGADSRMREDSIYFSIPRSRSDTNLSVTKVRKLWQSRDPDEWDRALTHYWDFVQPANLGLEREMESLDAQRVQELD